MYFVACLIDGTVGLYEDLVFRIFIWAKARKSMGNVFARASSYAHLVEVDLFGLREIN